MLQSWVQRQTGMQNSLLGDCLFTLRPSNVWMSPTTLEVNLFYSKTTDLNVNHIWKIHSLQYLDWGVWPKNWASKPSQIDTWNSLSHSFLCFIHSSMMLKRFIHAITGIINTYSLYFKEWLCHNYVYIYPWMNIWVLSSFWLIRKMLP